ncbi:MAG: MarR family EPS-associated transcriptional regulator [Leptospiraceae bacterium]|nr:MarR family EPS-associated transcriptional regulator [Leptospiraceae bacterium]
MTDELQHKLFKLIAENPHISQRELSRALGISLGKANYCLKALIEKGWVKVQNFKNNKNKWGYLYLLTPSGIEEKARVTMRYLKRKMQEYDELKAAVAQLKREVEMEQRQLAKRGMVFTSHRQY